MTQGEINEHWRQVMAKYNADRDAASKASDKLIVEYSATRKKLNDALAVAWRWKERV